MGVIRKYTMAYSNLEWGYWESWGYGQSSRYIMNYCKDHDFKMKEYKFDNVQQWGEDKPKHAESTDFPNLPYLKFEKDGEQFHITESEAILRALGEITGLVGETVEENIKMDTVTAVLVDWFQGFSAAFSDNATFKQKVADFNKNQIKRGTASQIDAHLAKNKYVAGDRLTWVDFKMLHWVFVMNKLSAVLLHRHKNIARFMEHMVNNLGDEHKRFYEEENATRMIFPSLSFMKMRGFEPPWPGICGVPAGEVKPFFAHTQL